MTGRWLPGAVIVLYFLLAGLQIAQRPGLQYDEALLVAGAVHMRHSPSDFPLPHSEFTWLCVRGRCLPLMAEIPYVGALKEYLAVPLFALRGPSLAGIRWLGVLLAAIGIWGVMQFARTFAGAWAGVGAGLALAINPAYIAMTAFDNNAIAGMMAGLGLLFLALGRYVDSKSVSSAFMVGLAAGFTIWMRANTLWILAAMALAAVLVFRWELGKRPVAEWLAACGGAIAGGLPFLVYQAYSGLGTWRAAGQLMDTSPMGVRLGSRLVMFAETLLSDREHRAMWGGADMGDITRWLPLFVVLAACGACLGMPGASRFAKFSSLAFLLLTVILFATPMQLAEHHLIVALPFALLVTVVAAVLGLKRFPRVWPAFAALGVAYLAGCLYWQILAIRGLHDTGGMGMWSDSITELTARIEQDFPNRLIRVVDWGLQDNLYVLSDGRIRSREIFGDATEQQSGQGRSWTDEIRTGGVFVVAGSENRHESGGTYFVRALAATHPVLRRQLMVEQRSGVTYAEIFDIEPNSVQTGSPAEGRGVVSISMGDPAAAAEIGGFHRIEDGAWRWTQQNFFVMLAAPSTISGLPWLEVNLYLPDGLTRRLGPITLSARVGSHTLKPERYDHDGPYAYSRPLDASWLENGGGTSRIDFSLDKVQSPTAADQRELGIVVKDVSIRIR